MKEYKVISTDLKLFSLTLSDKEIGTLQYEKWYSFKAEIILADNTIYTFETKGFWGTTIELKEDDVVLLNLKKDWMGKIIIRTWFDETEKDFIFKPRGILGGSYVLMDMDMQQHPNFMLHSVIKIQQIFLQTSN